MSAPAPHPAVETAFLAPEAVLYDERTGGVYHLNPSASAVWLLIDGELGTDALAGELSDIFATPVDVVRPDVAAAVAEFAEQGLLVGSPEPAPAPVSHSHGPTIGPMIGPVVLPRPPDP